MTASVETLEGTKGLGASYVGRLAVMAIFGTIAALQLTNVFRREVNWDEFHFLAQIFEYERGQLHWGLQTFHVHLFSWITALPAEEVTMIVTARVIMWLLHLATLWFLYQIANRLVPGGGALWAVTTYATFFFVVQHGTSFRADPIITALLMGALYGLTRERLGLASLTMVSLAVALAGLISIKSVLYVPIIAALACLRLVCSTKRARLLRDMSIALLIGGAVFTWVLAWHSTLLGQSSTAVAIGVASASDKQFLDRELLQGGIYLLFSLMASPVQWAAFLLGTVIAAMAAITAKDMERLRAITILSFASPLLLIIFYRNSFPYFYVFMLAPVAILASLSLEAHDMLRRRELRIPALLVILAAAQFVAQWQRDNDDQKALISAVHELFPEPVPYIDRAGMIASFPRAGFLMSTSVMENYRRRGEPTLLRAIEEKKPLFLIVSGYPLTAALETSVPSFPESTLLPTDATALRENYIQHWGVLWVAGKELPSTNGVEGFFQVVIPGDYTVEAEGSLNIDGREVSPGETVRLEAGKHIHSGGRAVLRYGRNLAIPAGIPPATVFTGF